MRSDEGNPLLDLEAFRRTFFDQLERFRQLFNEEMGRVGKPIDRKPTKAVTLLGFVEELMVCPTEASVLARIQRDRELASLVYILGGDMRSGFDAAYAQRLMKVTAEQTPFFELALALKIKLDTTIAAEGKDYIL